MKRTNRRHVSEGRRSVAVMRLSMVPGPLPALLALLVFWVVSAEQGGATGRTGIERLVEVGTLDAQVAPGLANSPNQRNNLGLFSQRIQALIPDARRNCLPISDSPRDLGRRSRTAAQRGLEIALETIRQSATGAWLADVAAARQVTLCVDHATELEAHYRSHLRLLGLNVKLDPAGQIVFLAHELAHVPQHPRFSNNRRFSPSDMLLLQRVREASAEAVATRVLWQLREQGLTAPWRQKLTTAYHDIAETFETAMAEQSGTGDELAATRSAFHHWFDADWRREIYDDLMLKALSRIADDPIGLIPTSRHLSDRYLLGIADYAGQNFLMSGDGRALIHNFYSLGLPAQDRVRLEAILAKAESRLGRAKSSTISSETLSAVSPEPRDKP